MRLGENKTIFAGNMQQEDGPGKVRLVGARKAEGGGSAGKTNDGADGPKENRKTIFAGELGGNLTLQDRIRQRREEARKQAMKVVNDTWNSERKLDQDIDDRKQHFAELQQEYGQAKDRLKDIRSKQDEIQRNGGVAEDDQRQLELEKEAAFQQNILAEKEVQMRMEDAVIRGSRLERLKKAPMLEAAAQAQQIKDAAEEEIAGLVMEEARDHLAEEQEKREEQAQAIQEKKEEREELLEKSKEREEELEELIEKAPVEEMLQLDDARSNVQQEVQNIINKMNLLAEDIKGAMVDTGV